MEARARRTDPVTSHEAAATVKQSPAQKAVLTFIKNHMEPGFTDKDLVAAYHTHAAEMGLPMLADSGIRSRRKELVKAGDVVLVEIVNRTGRREQTWQVAA